LALNPASGRPRKPRYGTLKAWAEQLGLDDAAELLQETLDEEEATDEALTEIAKSAINQRAEAA
jgi:ferritin-like metal-binding protein YciE